MTCAGSRSSLSWVELSDGQYEDLPDPIDEVVNHRRLPARASSRSAPRRGLPRPWLLGSWGVEVLSDELRNLPIHLIFHRAYDATASQFANERSST